jgi:hypothetical protein
MRIDSAGNLLINGTTVATSNGGLTITNTSSGAMTAPFALRNAGTANGSGVWITHRGVTAAGAESDYNYIGFVATDTTARTGHITFQTASGGTLAEKMRIDSTGLLTLPYGQIKFPATQNASSDANTLDDYEEGTWTAAFATEISGTVTIDTSYRTASYTKVGRLVTVHAQLVVGSISSPVGGLLITGLPFTISASAATPNRGLFPVSISGISSGNSGNFIGQIINGESKLYVYYNNGTVPEATAANKCQANAGLYFCATYITT